jgi:hypothetical protein
MKLWRESNPMVHATGKSSCRASFAGNAPALGMVASGLNGCQTFVSRGRREIILKRPGFFSGVGAIRMVRKEGHGVSQG